MRRDLQSPRHSIRPEGQRSQTESRLNNTGARIRAFRCKIEKRIRLRPLPKRGDKHRVRTYPQCFRTVRWGGSQAVRWRDSEEDSFHSVRWFERSAAWQQLLFCCMLHVRHQRGSNSKGTHAFKAGCQNLLHGHALLRKGV